MIFNVYTHLYSALLLLQFCIALLYFVHLSSSGRYPAELCFSLLSTTLFYFYSAFCPPLLYLYYISILLRSLPLPLETLLCASLLCSILPDSIPLYSTLLYYFRLYL